MHVSLGRDVKLTGWADLRTVTEKDPCPKCGGRLELPKGIEVGHVFKLGTKYSKAMNASFLDEQGKEQSMIMGCYGIGVSRIVAACIEQNNDDSGIVFPPPIAPFEVVVVALGSDGDVAAKSGEIYELLKAGGLDVILDDRDERPGVKFKDADLVGMPMQLVVGGKGLGRGVIEAKDRRTGERSELPVEGFEAAFLKWMAEVRSGWGLD
jgi:prolyl-tRNA synthetase